jgi:hypothetical protein
MKTTAPLKNYGKEILSRRLETFFTSEKQRYAFKKTYEDFCTPFELDFKTTTTEERIEIIREKIKHPHFFIHSSSISNKARFYKKFWKITENVEITEEYLLVSSFCNIMVDREQVTTEIKDGDELKNCANNPYDMDYNISPKNIAKVLEDGLADPSKKKKDKKEIFSVATQNSGAKIPPCPNCKGKGVLRCEHCGGSGREQYVDGYYASGEERVKTGNCAHCYGQGNIQCEACGGEGKPQIYSDKYQIIKRFDDKQTILRYDCMSGLSNVWEQFEEAYYDDLDERIYNAERSVEDRGEGLDENDIKDIKTRKFLIQDDDNLWCKCNNKELEQYIDKLHKNQHETIIDNNGQPMLAMLKEKGQEYCELYQKNKEAAYSKWEELELLNGQLGCSLEYHEVVPVIRINCINKKNGEEITIFLMEHNPFCEGMFGIIKGASELTFWEALFL